MSEEAGPTDDDSTHLTSVVASVVTMLTLVTAFGLLAIGWEYFWIVFPIGFGGVLPAATAIAGWREAKRKQTETVRQTGAGGKLATLREQYANGEIDEITFERKVERLLETESIEDAKLFYGDEGPDTDEAETATETTEKR
jgi:uncharacterized membrane protein